MKAISQKIRHVIAYLIIASMFMMMVPISSYAVEETGNGADPSIVAVDKENPALSALITEAKNLNIGVGGQSSPVPMPSYGNVLAAYSVTSENKLVDIEIDKPDISEDMLASGVANQYGERYKIAVQNAEDPDAPVYVFPAEIVNNQLKVTIPTFDGKVICAVFLDNTTASAIYSTSYPGEKPETYYLTNTASFSDENILENSKGNEVEYTWNFQLNENTNGVYTAKYSSFKAEIRLNLGDLINPEISVESTALKMGEPYEDPENSGAWIVPLETPDNLTSNDFLRNNGVYDLIKVSVKADVPTDAFLSNDDLFVIAEIIMKNGENTNTISETALLGEDSVAKMTPAVNITPADMTIYEGGTQGYEGAVDENGELISGMPHPMFYLEGSPVADVTDKETLDGLEFYTQDENGNDEKIWTVVRDGTDSTGKDLYHFEAAEGTPAVQLNYSYTDPATGATTTITGSEFDPSEVKETYQNLTVSIYEGENEADFSNIKARFNAENAGEEDTPVTLAETDGIAINVHEGSLIRRSVEAENPISPVQEAAPESPVTEGAVAVVDPNTTYKLNGQITIPDGTAIAPSLLFDDIITSDGATTEDGKTRVEALETRAASYLDEQKLLTGNDRNYQIKFLDLVDANNGNAWISSSAGVDIYWAYPDESLDQNSKDRIQVLHFPGLHRDTTDGATTGFDPDAIASTTIETVEFETTKQGIKFHVGEGDFSPYAVVWTDKAEDPSPGPDPDTPVGPVHPVDPTPELEHGDHYAYIVGYEDDTIRPQNNITRAEVATIFFRLLTDESREAYFTTDCDFTDVNGGAWYANTVATLSNAGILAGYPDGSFRPNDSITRAEFAAIATRFDDLAAADSTFTDIDGHWAEDAINAAYGAGWVGGYPDGTFRPNNNITRAEVMSLVNRVLDREVDEDGMLDDMLTWIDNEPGTWYYEAVQEATNSHDYEREDVDSLETWTKINEPIDWDQVESDLLN